MKKIATLLTAAAMLASNSGYAQTTQGAAAQAGKTYSNDNFAWGIGLGMLAVVGIVVGVTVGTSTSSPSSFSH